MLFPPIHVPKKGMVCSRFQVMFICSVLFANVFLVLYGLTYSPRLTLSVNQLWWDEWYQTTLTTKISKTLQVSCDDVRRPCMNSTCIHTAISSPSICSRALGRGGMWNELWVGSFNLDRDPYQNLELLPDSLAGWPNAEPSFWRKI